MTKKTIFNRAPNRTVNVKDLYKLLFLIFCGIGTMHLQSQNNPIDSLTQLLTKDNSPEERAEVLVALTRTLTDEDSEKALPYGREALSLSRQIRNQKGEQESQIHLGTAHFRLGNLDSAAYYFNSAYALPISQETSSKKGALKNNLGMVAEAGGSLQESIRHYEDALQIYTLLDDTLRIGGVTNNLGLVYKKQGNLTGALEAFLAALKKFESINHISAQASVLNNLGMVNQDQRTYDDALKFYRQSLALKKELGNQYGIALTLNNIATVHNEQERIDSAKWYHQQSLKIKEEINDKMGLATSYNNLGEISNKLGDYSEGRDLNLKALELSTESGDLHNEAYSLLELGKAYRGLKQYQKALTTLLQGSTLAENLTELPILLQFYHELYELYKPTDAAKALSYHELAVSLKDSILDRESLRSHTQMQMQYSFDKETELKDKEIELLNTENELSALRVSTLKKRNLYLGLGFILFSILSIFLYRLYNKIQSQNKIIAASLSQKETLLKEIHHRVKNNLQIISSLLSLQSRSIHDEVATAALKESQNRVKSMALIHQNLYQDGQSIGVSTKDYLEKLTQNLFGSYNIDREKINLSLDVDDLRLDVDQVIPLGLIINELLSNALKYAFGDSGGTIDLQLKAEGSDLLLRVHDNGRGLPADFSWNQTKSLGYRLIRSFVAKLNATLNLTNNNGAEISIRIPDALPKI